MKFKKLSELRKIHISQLLTLKNVFRLVVPILLIIIIFAMWQYKHQDESMRILQGGYDEPNDPFALVTEFIDYEKIFDKGLPVIVDYGKPNCPVCKTMAPMLKDYNKTLRDKAYIKFVDVVQNPENLDYLRVSYPPLQVFFLGNGKAYIPSEEISASLDFRYIILNEEGETEEIAAEKFKGEKMDKSKVLVSFHRGELNETQWKEILFEMGIIENA